MWWMLACRKTTVCVFALQKVQICPFEYFLSEHSGQTRWFWNDLIPGSQQKTARVHSRVWNVSRTSFINFLTVSLHSKAGIKSSQNNQKWCSRVNQMGKYMDALLIFIVLLNWDLFHHLQEAHCGDTFILSLGSDWELY